MEYLKKERLQEIRDKWFVPKQYNPYATSIERKAIRDVQDLLSHIDKLTADFNELRWVMGHIKIEDK